MTNAFHILGLPVEYNLSEDVIQSRYHTEVALWHPDRASTAIEKTVATQRSRTLNEAYQKLVHPLQRAEEVMKAKEWEALPPGPEFLAWILDQDIPSFQKAWQQLMHDFSQAIAEDNQTEASKLFGQMSYIYPRLQGR